MRTETEPLVSAVIPAYNAEPFIEEAINSVLAQRYKNIEIVVVDDGSTDRTREKLARFKDVTCICLKHGGIAAARNAGIERSHGTYIAFLDADDVWLPNKTDLQMRFLLDNPDYAAVGSDWLTFEDKRVISESYLTSRHIDEKKGFFENLLKENIALTSTVVAKKEVIVKLGMFDPSFVTITYEDRDLMLRIAARYKFGLIKETLLKKRSHPGQISRAPEAVIEGQILMFEKLINQEKGIRDDSSTFLKKKLEELYITAAYHYLKSDRSDLAKKNAMKAIKLNPGLISAWKTLLQSFFRS